VDGDAAILERRWFAAVAAAKAMHSECEVLKAVVQQAEADLALALAQLETLQRLRDGLGEKLAALDLGNSGVMSAA
jgi:uncharacterized protein YqfA (UPF0365 family)